MTNEPICVHRASSEEEAEVIVAWLDEQGIEATIVGRQNPGVIAFGVTDEEGVGVYVTDESTAVKAKTLLAERYRAHAAKSESPETMIEVKCDGCGEVNHFTSELTGSVQACVECGAYLDVPGNS